MKNREKSQTVFVEGKVRETVLKFNEKIKNQEKRKNEFIKKSFKKDKFIAKSSMDSVDPVDLEILPKEIFKVPKNNSNVLVKDSFKIPISFDDDEDKKGLFNRPFTSSRNTFSREKNPAYSLPQTFDLSEICSEQTIKINKVSNNAIWSFGIPIELPYRDNRFEMEEIEEEKEEEISKYSDLHSDLPSLEGELSCFVNKEENKEKKLFRKEAIRWKNKNDYILKQNTEKKQDKKISNWFKKYLCLIQTKK